MRLPFVRLERTVDAPRPRCRPPLVELVLEESPGGPARPLADLIAPAAISITADHLVLDGQFARVLALVGLPPAADPGWLEPLVAATLPAAVSHFVTPADLGTTADRLARRHTRLQSSLGHDAAEGRPTDPDLLAADEQVARLRHALARAAGLGLVAISQDVRVVLVEHGRTIAENAATACCSARAPRPCDPWPRPSRCPRRSRPTCWPSAPGVIRVVLPRMRPPTAAARGCCW